jgi:hypothetical protein
MESTRNVLNDGNKSKGDARLWLVFLILLPWLLNTIRTPNNDFGLISAIVRDWVAGKAPLYGAGSVYYNYTPWLLLVYLPVSFIPHPFGQLIFNTLSLSLLIWSTWYLSKPISWWAMAISLTTVYTGMLIMLGQWDALVLASLTLGWIGFQRRNPWVLGIALVGMTTKYTNVIIPMLLLLFAIRAWPIQKIIRLAIIPLVTLGGSFLVAGWDWPIRYSHLLSVTLAYFHNYEVMTIFSKATYPISYGQILPPFGTILIICLAGISFYLLFRIVRRGVNLDSMNLALALNLVISPYFTFHHLIYLAPLQAQMLNKHRVWGFIMYGGAILDLLLMWLGVGLIVYPLVALVILIIVTFGSLPRSESLNHETTLGPSQSSS